MRVQRLLSTPAYYFYKNTVGIHNLRYMHSFSLHEVKNKQADLKVMMRDRMGNHESPGVAIKALMDSQTQQSHFDYQIQDSFFLFSQFRGLLGDESDSLREHQRKEQDYLFVREQERHYDIERSQKAYSYFLIELSMLLNNYSDLLIFKTAHTCETTQLKIDMAVLDKKVALIYVPPSQQVTLLDKNTKVPSNLLIRKGHLLHQNGWTVHFMHYAFPQTAAQAKSVKQQLNQIVSAFGPSPVSPSKEPEMQWL